MDALEMARRLVVLGIADRSEGVMGLERDLPQRRAHIGECRGGEGSPFCRATVEVGGSTIQHALRAGERDEVVGELVLKWPGSGRPAWPNCVRSLT